MTGTGTDKFFTPVIITVRTSVRCASGLVAAVFIMLLASCSSPRYIGRTNIPERFLDDPVISGSHVGIAIYDADQREYLYTHNYDKFFVPASNVKIPTLYAGLKYLGNGIPGIRYAERDDTLFLFPTGDPTFMLPDYADQPVFEFLSGAGKPIVFLKPEWKTGALGYGWPWNFYLNYYMPERSPFPVYGNVITWLQREMPGPGGDVSVTALSSFPGHPWPVDIRHSATGRFEVTRPLADNDYAVYLGFEGDSRLYVPFVTNGIQSAIDLLVDTIDISIGIGEYNMSLFDMHDIPVYSDLSQMDDLRSGQVYSRLFRTIYSRPCDSLFRPMMLYSDNFFAEQTLIMLSNELLGVMDEQLLIEYLLENDLSGIPDKPRWVDGSGLSRYNLFSPRSFVWLLERMKDEFGYERVYNLLPTGGEGTLEDHFPDVKGKIFAKTGTLGGNAVSLSGYIITSGGRRMIFSVLVNNHNVESNAVRTATESFLKDIIGRY